jgi:hypothetical protein
MSNSKIRLEIYKNKRLGKKNKEANGRFSKKKKKSSIKTGLLKTGV